MLANKICWKGRAFKALSYGLRSSKAGRNFSGSITIFHRGGGAKRLLRRIDFQRKNLARGFIERIEYDPNRTARIALVRWADFGALAVYGNDSVEKYNPERAGIAAYEVAGPSSGGNRFLFRRRSPVKGEASTGPFTGATTMAISADAVQDNENRPVYGLACSPNLEAAKRVPVAFQSLPDRLLESVQGKPPEAGPKLFSVDGAQRNLSRLLSYSGRRPEQFQVLPLRKAQGCDSSAGAFLRKWLRSFGLYAGRRTRPGLYARPAEARPLRAGAKGGRAAKLRGALRGGRSNPRNGPRREACSLYITHPPLAPEARRRRRTDSRAYPRARFPGLTLEPPTSRVKPGPIPINAAVPKRPSPEGPPGKPGQKMLLRNPGLYAVPPKAAHSLLRNPRGRSLFPRLKAPLQCTHPPAVKQHFGGGSSGHRIGYNGLSLSRREEPLTGRQHVEAGAEVHRLWLSFQAAPLLRRPLRGGSLYAGRSSPQDLRRKALRGGPGSEARPGRDCSGTIRVRLYNTDSLGRLPTKSSLGVDKVETAFSYILASDQLKSGDEVLNIIDTGPAGGPPPEGRPLRGFQPIKCRVKAGPFAGGPGSTRVRRSRKGEAVPWPGLYAGGIGLRFEIGDFRSEARASRGRDRSSRLPPEGNGPGLSGSRSRSGFRRVPALESPASRSLGATPGESKAAGSRPLFISTANLYQKSGISLPLWLAPIGSVLHNIELYPGGGGKLARAAGTSAQLVQKEPQARPLRPGTGSQRKLPRFYYTKLASQRSPKAWALRRGLPFLAGLPRIYGPLDSPALMGRAFLLYESKLGDLRPGLYAGRGPGGGPPEVLGGVHPFGAGSTRALRRVGEGSGGMRHSKLGPLTQRKGSKLRALARSGGLKAVSGPAGGLALTYPASRADFRPAKRGLTTRFPGLAPPGLSGFGSEYTKARDGLCTIRLPSGQQQLLDLRCRATIGVVSNIDHWARILTKAGQRRWLGFRPVVRGVAMNPIDHPHGGGEGRTKGGRPSLSPWGKPTKAGFRGSRKGLRIIKSSY